MIDIVKDAPLTTQIRGLGFGAGAIGNLYREIADTDAMTALRTALDHRMKYFDTAPHYGFGLSEKRLGHVLGEIGGAGDIVVSTKVGRVLVPTTALDLRTARQGFISPEPRESVFDYSYDGIMRSFEASRRRLGRDFDILYVHDLGRRTHGQRHSAQMRLFMDEGYRALRGLRQQGAVRAIGLGVNEWQVCEEVLATVELDIVLLAGRYTLLEQQALESFLPLCVRRGIAVVVGGPYNSGILARDGQTHGAAHYDYGRIPADIRARVDSIEAVCARHGVPLAAAALQFPLAHPAVVSVIPGMSSAAEVAAAVRWMSIRIPTACWQELQQQGLLRADAPIPVPCSVPGS
jgi:D-threo-aldose 1-dehydrogenase